MDSAITETRLDRMASGFYGMTLILGGMNVAANGSVAQQWQAWQRSGEWTSQDAAIVAFLAQVPFASTSQLAWALYVDVQNNSALVMARAAMRRLRQMAVVEHRRLWTGDRGRPEDCYRLLPEWAVEWAVTLVPLDPDWRRDWVTTERYCQSMREGTALRLHPEGDSQADWVVLYQESERHWHRYEYLIDRMEDQDRMWGALRAVVDRFGIHFASAPTRLMAHCARAGCDGVDFRGWDVGATFGPPDDRRGTNPWYAYLMTECEALAWDARIVRAFWVSHWIRDAPF